MKKKIIALSAFLGLSYATQAQAGYVPVNPSWTQISSSVSSLAGNGMFQNLNGPLLTESRTWTWTGGGTPASANITLGFDVSLGATAIGTAPTYASRTTAYGGFSSSMMLGNDAWQ